MQNIALAVAYEVRSLTLGQQAMSNDKPLCVYALFLRFFERRSLHWNFRECNLGSLP
ncbi:hypothetical protein [aff. Roholtiella sp. LEGE 12411]|uniref:hypothetical protein n=1 Tax=aff. Roholtiella sp. LEGE 12411 TaxID=1828822 RepID=UPI00188257EA|nr:hypothetical protein [aff. Roholtiella sp. LEGE 12411]MBE9036201.1 hypothetical protein [aff. Roholtiella sp. LEGE 12411]